MKINSRATKEILSQFENFQVKIKHSPVTGVTVRTTHAISTISSTSSLKFDEDNYLDEMNGKVLCSKSRLKRHSPEKQINENKKSKGKIIKKGVLGLRRILNRIKIPKDKIKKDNLVRPHKKPMSMKIKEMKRLTHITKKKNTYNYNMKNLILSSNESNEYDFKINVLKIKGDTCSDNETNDNDTYSNTSNKLCFRGTKQRLRKNQIKFDDSSDGSESS